MIHFETKCARAWVVVALFLHDVVADFTSSFLYTHTSIIL